MSFKPKPSEPKIHVDRWVVACSVPADGENWIHQNFKVLKANAKKMQVARIYTVAPRFDPTDVFEIYLVRDKNEVYGLNFYEVIDLRAKLTIDQDAVLLENSLTHTLIKKLIPLRPPNVHQSPHPNPPGKEKHRDYTHLRRSWVSPDPIIHQELDDECSTFDGPEWLAPQKRLR